MCFTWKTTTNTIQYHHDFVLVGLKKTRKTHILWPPADTSLLKPCQISSNSISLGPITRIDCHLCHLPKTDAHVGSCGWLFNKPFRRSDFWGKLVVSFSKLYLISNKKTWDLQQVVKNTVSGRSENERECANPNKGGYGSSQKNTRIPLTSAWRWQRSHIVWTLQALDVFWK